MDNKLKDLIAKYNAGDATPTDIAEIEKAVERGIMDISELNDMRDLEDRLLSVETPSPSLSLDDKFYDMLVSEKRAANRAFDWKKFFSMPELLPRLSFAGVFLIIGLVAGYLLRPAESSNQQVGELAQQVTELKEMMMLSLLEKESASDRLKAVSLTHEMDQASRKVTMALLQTLNEDANVNVRLAALEALKPYAKDSNVKQELIRSIAQQNSPLVQIGLAELMVQLQEKSSVKELQKILKSEKTPRDVKKKIEESIDVLI